MARPASKTEKTLEPVATALDSERYHVPNLGRALLILEHLAKEARPSGAGVSEIAEQLDLPKNSVFRILTTLHAYGYIKRDETTKHYTLASKLLALGYAAVGEGGLVDRSLDILRQLRDDTDETAVIGIIDGHEGVILEQVVSEQQMRVNLAVGTRFPLHTAAPAKAYLAHVNDDHLERLLPLLPFTKYTETTITDADSFIDEIVEARRCGYGVDNGEHNPHVRCFGGAVLDHRSQPIGCIWVTGPSSRIPDERFESVGKAVAAAAARISRRFGYGS